MTRRSFYNALITGFAVIALAGGVFAQGRGNGKGGDRGDRGNRGGGQEKHWRGNNDQGNRGDRGNGWGRRERGGEDFNRQAERQQRQQYDYAIRQQREQQRQNERFARDQQRAYQQQYEQQRRSYSDQYERREPRGNAYGNRGIWPGEFRGWRDPEKQQRKYEKQLRKQGYYYRDPIGAYYPQYRSYNYQPRRDNLVRRMIANFFTSQPVYSPLYRESYAPAYYPRYRMVTYSQPYDNYYYSNASYSPAYYNNGYASDPYYYGDNNYYGGNSLKSSLLNVGLSLLQGFLGQGYEQGLVNGQCARNYGNYNYAPYTTETVYYSPVVSSIAEQRQAYDEGYRLGYQDALRNNDPYNSYNTGRVDLVTEFLANSLTRV